MLDTDVIDKLSQEMDAVRQVGEAVDRGDIELIVTSVQVDELARIPDVEKRSLTVLALLGCRARLVPTSMVVLDVSRWDLAQWGDEAESAGYDLHLGTGSNRTRHAQDATIAATAAKLGATLVTENTKRIGLARCVGILGFASSAPTSSRPRSSRPAIDVSQGQRGNVVHVISERLH